MLRNGSYWLGRYTSSDCTVYLRLFATKKNCKNLLNALTLRATFRVVPRLFCAVLLSSFSAARHGRRFTCSVNILFWQFANLYGLSASSQTSHPAVAKALPVNPPELTETVPVLATQARTLRLSAFLAKSAAASATRTRVDNFLFADRDVLASFVACKKCFTEVSDGQLHSISGFPENWDLKKLIFLADAWLPRLAVG